MVNMPIIPPTQPLVTPSGLMDRIWYRFFVSFFNNTGAGGTLGTAAFKNVGGSGDAVPLLNQPNTFSATVNFSAPVEIAGTTQTFPASGKIVGTTDAQVLTNKTIDSALNTVKGEQLIGTTTNDAAVAGNIGEYLFTSVASGGAVSLVSGTPKNIALLTCTPGDYDVWATGAFTFGALTNVTNLAAAVNTTTLIPTLDTGSSAQTDVSLTGAADISLHPGPVRVSFAATTPVFLVAKASFATSTCAGYGALQVRRVR